MVSKCMKLCVEAEFCGILCTTQEPIVFSNVNLCEVNYKFEVLKYMISTEIYIKVLEVGTANIIGSEIRGIANKRVDVGW